MPGNNRKHPLDKTESIFSIIMCEKASPYLKSLKFFLTFFLPTSHPHKKPKKFLRFCSSAEFHCKPYHRVTDIYMKWPKRDV